jgi:hypothetical protein
MILTLNLIGGNIETDISYKFKNGKLISKGSNEKYSY